MKTVLRILIATLVLAGTCSTVSYADGGDPVPLCDPADPDCRPPIPPMQP